MTDAVLIALAFCALAVVIVAEGAHWRRQVQVLTALAARAHGETLEKSLQAWREVEALRAGLPLSAVPGAVPPAGPADPHERAQERARELERERLVAIHGAGILRPIDPTDVIL